MTSDAIETKIYLQIKADSVLGLLDVKKGKSKPVTEATVNERIVIRHSASDNSSFQHSFGYVYVYCPLVSFTETGTTYKRENSTRVAVLEAAVKSLFKKTTIYVSSETLRYKADTITKEEDTETFSTVITIKLRITNNNF